MIFEWWQYSFMQNAFWAILIVAPIFSLVGPLIINARMSFFSEAIGHSALTAVAISSLLGLSNPLAITIIYSLIFSFIVTVLKHKSPQKTDTFIALTMSFSVALGLMILSKSGNLSKFSQFLVGDILSLNEDDLKILLILLVASAVFFFLFYKKILLVSLNQSLAKSRGINIFLTEFLFASFISVIVSLGINSMGLLVINSLIILPAILGSYFAKNIRSHFFLSIFISLFSSLVGLDLSYRLETATGPTIVVVIMILFLAIFLKRS